MSSRVIQALILFISFGLIWLLVGYFSNSYHKSHYQPSKQGGGATSKRDRFYEHQSFKSWETEDSSWFYGIAIGYDDFTPNFPEFDFNYSYSMKEGGILSVNGKGIKFSEEKYLLASDPFGKMVEIKLNEEELSILSNGTVEEVWRDIVLKRLFEFKGIEDFNKPQGYLKCYDKNSNIAYEGNFKDGLKEGVWIYYYPDGNKKAELIYAKGRRQGDWKYFSKEGELKETFRWKNDFPVDKPISQSSMSESTILRPDKSFRKSIY